MPTFTFDTDVAGWAAGQFTITRVTTSPRSGTGHARLVVATGGGQKTTQTNPRVAAAPGETWAGSAWVRWYTGTPKEVGILVQFYDAGGTMILNPTPQTIVPDSTWKELKSTPVVAPAGTATARLQLRMPTTAEGDGFDVDDITFDAEADVPETSYSMWNGTSEVPILSFEVVTAQGTTQPVTFGS